MTQTDELPTLLRSIRNEIAEEYRRSHEHPWLVGFSGGKDSTLVLQLVCEVLLDLPRGERRRTVHVVANDTLVESPVVQAFVDKTLSRIEASVPALGLPLVVAKTTPGVEGSFWVNLIGRGYPAPNRLFRWCTDRMKIRPTTRYLRERAAETGEAILLLGVRRQESSARAKSVQRYDNGERLNRHNSVQGCWVFRPIVELSTDDVWTTLMQTRPPWGGTHRELVTLYRNGQGGECPFVVDEADAPACGTTSSRFGCWTCTVVEKDKSMQGFIDAGFEHLEPLADFRDWLQHFSRDPNNRQTERRNGTPGLGPLTNEARVSVLEKLLEVQRDTDLPLIAEQEVTRIRELWTEDEDTVRTRKVKRFLNLVENT